MKSLPKKRILQVLKQRKWGTLIGVDGNKPYAIEVAYTSVGNYLYVIFNPAGRLAKCIKKNANVAFKVCATDDDMKKWEAAIVEGTIKRVTQPKEIKSAFRALAQKLGYDKTLYDKMAEKYAAISEQSPVHRLPLKAVGGRSSF